MNRLVALDNYRRTDRPETISPMVISGTHALDIVMWLLEGRRTTGCSGGTAQRCATPATASR